MSLRLSERYQAIQLKNGSRAYRIYNLDIISRLNALSESESILTQGHEEKDEKRCTFRTITFLEPEIHFYMNQQSQQSRETYQYTQHNVGDHYIGNVQGYKSFMKHPLPIQKQNSFYGHINGKSISISNSVLDSSNSEQHTPKYVTKKISKDKKYKFKINHTHQYLNQTLPESSASQATSTQIMISTQDGLKSPKIQSNSNQKLCSNISDKQEINYSHLQIPASLMNYRDLNIDNYLKLNIETKIEQDENSNEIDLHNQQSECDPRKFISLNIKSGRNLNQTTNDLLYQNKNINYFKDSNCRIINNFNRNNDLQIQYQQTQSIKKESQLINNKKFMTYEKPNSLPGEYNLLMSSKIPNQSQYQKENKNVNERKISFQNTLNCSIANNNQNENQIIDNFHNSDIFKNLSMEYKMIPKNNTLKNIKKAFIRYLLKTSRKQLIKKCEQFNLDVGHILTVLCQEIKYDHRHNKNIRFLLKSEQISPLFKDFLENSDDYWFSNSSLLNEGPCRQMVALLLKLTSNSQLVDVIQEYEK